MIILFTVLLLSSGLALAVDVEDESLSIEQSSEHLQPLKGKRLFFEEQERDFSQVVSGDASNSVSAQWRADAMGQAVKRGYRSDVPVQEVVRDKGSFMIRYDARVQSEETIRIIVNGVPCERMDRTISSVRKDRRVSCSSLHESALQLRLLDDGRRVRVLRESVELGVLIPGQAL